MPAGGGARPPYDHRMGEDDYRLALRVMTMPRDTNHSGTVFGGVIMSMIDQAAYVQARSHGLHRWVTVAMEKIEFHAPVFTGELVTLRTRTVRSGRTSVTVHVVVDAERVATGEVARVTEATVTMVSVDASRKPIPFDSPVTLTDLTDAERG